MKLMQPTLAQVHEHYAEHKGKDWFDGVCAYFCSGPICAMVWEGKDVIRTGRMMIGKADPGASPQGSFRGDLCVDWTRNVIHGSDSQESATREIDLWFAGQQPFQQYEHHSDAWIYE